MTGTLVPPTCCQRNEPWTGIPSGGPARRGPQVPPTLPGPGALTPRVSLSFPVRCPQKDLGAWRSRSPARVRHDPGGRGSDGCRISSSPPRPSPLPGQKADVSILTWRRRCAGLPGSGAGRPRGRAEGQRRVGPAVGAGRSLRSPLAPLQALGECFSPAHARRWPPPSPVRGGRAVRPAFVAGSQASGSEEPPGTPPCLLGLAPRGKGEHPGLLEPSPTSPRIWSKFRLLAWCFPSRTSPRLPGAHAKRMSSREASTLWPCN